MSTQILIQWLRINCTNAVHYTVSQNNLAIKLCATYIQESRGVATIAILVVLNNFKKDSVYCEVQRSDVSFS